jgi:hypothetical protein
LAVQEYEEIKQLILSQEQEYKGLFWDLLNIAFSNEKAK